MEKINNYILEKLKISSKSKINNIKYTFDYILNQYGIDKSIQLDKKLDSFEIDKKYTDNIEKIYNMGVHKWVNFYKEFMDSYNEYNDYPNEFQIHISQSQNSFINLEARICVKYSTKALSNIRINKNRNNNIELEYNLIDGNKKIEESLIKALYFLINNNFKNL